MLYQEQLADFLRFQKLEEFAAACNEQAPAFSAVSERHGKAIAQVVHRCVGEKLGTLLPILPSGAKKPKKSDEAEEILAQVVALLLEAEKLPEASLADLALLQKLLRGRSQEEKSEAAQQLQQLKENSDYFGVLRPALHSERWQSFVDSAQRPAKTSSAVSDLRKAFDFLNSTASPGSFFTEANRDNLVKAVALASSVPQAQSQLTSVLNGLGSASKEACAAQAQQIKTLCQRIVSQGTECVDVTSAKDFSDDLLRRGWWQCLKLEPVESDATDEDISGRRAAMSSLMKAGEALMKQRRTMELVLALAVSHRQFADSKTDESRERLLTRWGELKTLQQTAPGAEELTPAVSQQLDEVLAATRIAEVGPEFYNIALQAFGDKLLELLTRAVAAEFDTAAVKQAADGVREVQHITMQACSMSDTPSFARSCIEFACHDMLPVCEEAIQLSAREEKAVTEQVTETLLSHLSAACDLEKNKQRVLHLLPPEAADTFLQQAHAAKDKLAPILFEKMAGLRTQLENSAVSLEAYLLPLEKITNEDFLRQSIAGDALKKHLKTLAKAEKSLLAVAAPAARDDEALMSRAAKAKDRARKQITMWGALTLLNHQDVHSDNKQGKSLRAALQDIWAEHSKILKPCLGEDSAQMIENVIAGKMVQAAGQATAEEPEGAPKGTKRKKKAA